MSGAGLSPAKIKCRLNLTRIWIKMLNQVAIVAFYSCFEEQKGQNGILVLVGKAYNSLECRLIKLSAGYCRPAPTSIVTTLVRRLVFWQLTSQEYTASLIFSYNMAGLDIFDIVLNMSRSLTSSKFNSFACTLVVLFFLCLQW